MHRQTDFRMVSHVGVIPRKPTKSLPESICLICPSMRPARGNRFVKIHEIAEKYAKTVDKTEKVTYNIRASVSRG